MNTSFTILSHYKGNNIEVLINNIINIFKYGTPEKVNHLQSNKHLCEMHSEPEVVNVEKISTDNFKFTINLPLCLSGFNSGLALLLNSITYLSVFSEIEHYRVIEINLPEQILSQYTGPRNAIKGIRERLNVPKRALLGLIIKPRTKLDLGKLENILSLAAQTELDYIIDDELVVNPFCANIDQRIKIYSNFSKSKMFFINATADINISINIIEKALEQNINGIVLNAISMGLPSIKFIIDYFKGKPIFVVNNIGRGIITRHKYFGISESVFAFLTRLTGADAVYTGPLSKDFIYDDNTLKDEVFELQKKCFHIKDSFAVASGGINFNNVLNNTRILGTNLMLQMGSGFLTNPQDIQSKISLYKGILESLSFVNNDNEFIFSNIKSLFNTENLNKNMIMETAYLNRINDLKDSITKDYELLKKYEDSLRYENDPKTILKYQNGIKLTRNSLDKNYIELEQYTSSEEIMVDDVYLDIRERISQQLLKIHIAEIEKNLKSDIIELYNTFEGLSHRDNISTRVKEKLNEVIHEPDLSNKLKLTIPIIPLLLNYETELRISISPYAIWKKLLKLF